MLPGGEGCWDTALVMSSIRKDKVGRLIVDAIGALDHAARGVHLAWASRKIARLFPQLGRPRFEQQGEREHHRRERRKASQRAGAREDWHRDIKSHATG